MNKGIKFDTNKVPMDLIPYESLEEIAKVLGFGEKKYTTANWAKGIEMRRLISAALRHIGQFNSGEDFDSESETLHLANAATNLIFAIWMYKNRPDLDNRWVKNIINESKIDDKIETLKISLTNDKIIDEALYQDALKIQMRGR